MKTLLVATVAAAALALSAAAASAATTLEWTTENAFSTGCSGAGLNCTWLGHVTNPTPFSGARGTATADRGATIAGPDGAAVASIDGASPRGAGANYTFSYSNGSGGFEGSPLAHDWEGTLRFEGRVSFVAPPPPAGHGFTITVDDPRIVLNGDGTGFLYATGLSTPGAAGSEPVPYGEDAAIWELDLDGGTAPLAPNTPYPPAGWRIGSDGSQTLSGIVPRIETAGHAFPGAYPVDSGPNRTPNIFGSFAIRVTPDEVRGPAGPVGPAGPAGPVGSAGSKGSDGVTVRVVRRIHVAVLAKAPFGKGSRKVRVLRRGKLVARGRVKGKAVRVRLVEGVTKRLRGRYVLRVVGGKRRAVVRLG